MYSTECQNHAGIWTVDCGLDSGLNNKYSMCVELAITDCLSQGTMSVIKTVCWWHCNSSLPFCSVCTYGLHVPWKGAEAPPPPVFEVHPI